MQIPDPEVSRMRGVLDLDPMFALAGAVRAIVPRRGWIGAARRHQSDATE
jgi:hypothetical protein